MQHLHKNYPAFKYYTIPVGSTVDICDGSWMFTYRNGKKAHFGSFPQTRIPSRMKNLVVLGHENYGSDKNHTDREHPCDTQLVHLETGEIWYCQERTSCTNIREPKGSTKTILVPVEVPSDGTDYKITINVRLERVVKLIKLTFRQIIR